MNIRPETSADYAAVFAVNALAFGQENEARLVDLIRESDRYIPQLSLVATVDDRIVGHTLFSIIDLVGSETWQVLGLAPLAVHPTFQKQGIGSALVQVGLEQAEAMPYAMAIVLGHPAFYTRFGFVPSTEYGITSPFPVPAEAFMVKPLSQYQTHYQGKVVYPPAFAAV
jgi:putative acetyltransferase